MKNLNKYYVILLSVFIFSCSENNNESSSYSDSYDREELLENIVFNIIIPAHENHMQKLNDLQTQTNNFISEIQKG